MRKYLIFLVAFATILIMMGVNAAYAHPNSHSVRTDAMIQANGLSPPQDLQSNLITMGYLAENPGSMIFADNTAVGGRLNDIGDPKIKKVGLSNQSGTMITDLTKENTAQANEITASTAVENNLTAATHTNLHAVMEVTGNNELDETNEASTIGLLNDNTKNLMNAENLRNGIGDPLSSEMAIIRTQVNDKTVISANGNIAILIESAAPAYMIGENESVGLATENVASLEDENQAKKKITKNFPNPFNRVNEVANGALIGG